ncbi:hypothetical protein SUGI_0062730 [Cryptomeria japonica]|uniref:uncharacterized protein LOC131073480 n=1 Tax=Cryptomeria japonica TaxID=3369 RepID=UPI002408E4E9|nr:uncharacterized protein LOC131073480 [Cryptomeria japonica]GLJ07247.1 hypothetical protein SUGI_0062730 [Cryptomeria japonica]
MAKKAFKSRFAPSNSLPPVSTEASGIPVRETAFSNSSKRNREELRVSCLKAGESIKDLADKNVDMKRILASISEELPIKPLALSDRFRFFTAEIAYRRRTGEVKRENKEMKCTIEAVKALLSGYKRPARRVKLAECLEPEREVLELAMNANSINTLFDTVLPKLVGFESNEINEQGTSSKRPRTQ